MTKLFKLLIFTPIFVVFILLNCTKPDNSLYLQEIENLIESQPDSALNVLESIQSEVKGMNRRDRAYYSVLLVSARSFGDHSLVASDSLLNVAIDLLRSPTDNELLAKAWYYKGKVWEELREPQQALGYYQQGLELAEGKRWEIKSRIHNNIGGIFLNARLIENALLQYKESYNVAQHIAQRVTTLDNMGLTYLILENTDSAFACYNKALSLIDSLQDSVFWKNRLHSNLGFCHLEAGNNVEGLIYLKGITVKSKENYLAIGSTYLQLQQYDSARHYLMLSNVDGGNLVSNYELSELEEKLGNNKQALYYFKKASDQLDSIITNKHTDEIYTINQKYDIKRAVQKVEIAHQNRMIWIIMSVIIVFLLLIILFISYRKRKMALQNEKERRIQQQEQKLLLQEQEMMRKEKSIAILRLEISQAHAKTNAQIILRENEIATLQADIQRMSKQMGQERMKKEQTIAVLQSEIEKIKTQTTNELTKKEEELAELQKVVDDVHFNYFKKQSVYTWLLDALKDGKPLSIDQYRDLEKEVFELYSDFISTLNINCTSKLLKKEVLICCLINMKFNLDDIKLFFGLSDEAMRKQKSRIKGRMKNEKLFNSLFN